MSRCKSATVTNLSNRWTYGVFIKNTHRDYIRAQVSAFGAANQSEAGSFSRLTDFVSLNPRLEGLVRTCIESDRAIAVIVGRVSI